MPLMRAAGALVWAKEGAIAVALIASAIAAALIILFMAHSFLRGSGSVGNNSVPVIGFQREYRSVLAPEDSAEPICPCSASPSIVLSANVDCDALYPVSRRLPGSETTQTPRTIDFARGSRRIPPDKQHANYLISLLISLQSPKKHKNEHNNQYRAQETRATMPKAISIASKAATEATEQGNNEDDQENSSKRHRTCSTCRIAFRQYTVSIASLAKVYLTLPTTPHKLLACLVAGVCR
jgi:hypothetical protein